MNSIVKVFIILGGVIMFGCGKNKEPNQPLADFVDVDRFMGTWYVHGHVPTPLDKEAYAATETYEKSGDGKILTTYRYKKGSLDGKWKEMNPKGWVHDEETNSEWRMRFFGIFTSPYYILYVSDDYDETVIGHPDKDLAWIMTRSASIDEGRYEDLKQQLVDREYDLSDLRRVEH